MDEMYCMCVNTFTFICLLVLDGRNFFDYLIFEKYFKVINTGKFGYLKNI